MSATLLANELTNLVSEAKRKNADLRTAAEKSLQELKALPQTSEQQIAAACETRNTKFAGSGVVCLQRLVISKGLPKQRLKDALNAFNACTELGLDLQLKVLQALPSLLQNYAEDLKDDLLASALQVCASLQSAKVPTVSGVASATLQQLVAAVFEKVTDEDRRASSIPASAEIPGDDGPIRLRPAAFDAYRAFRDLVLAAEERSTKFVELKGLSLETSLELISSCLQGNPKLFLGHPELNSVIRSNLFPLVTRSLAEKQSFPVTVRSMRVLDFILCRQFGRFPGETEVAIGLLTQSLDSDAALPWKRALSMEVIRDVFATGSLVIEAYATYDQAEGGKPIVQDLLSSFVRLSAEKPATIGLGQQSSVPLGPSPQKQNGAEQTTIEAAGSVAGVISSALGVMEAPIAGISSQWSVPRTGCLDQFDKTEAPSLPDTYVYTLVLECLNSLSEGLAKVVLPLTVHSLKSEHKSQSDGNTENHENPTHLARFQSFRDRAVPLNPLEVEESPSISRARTVAALIDSCWPAVLATSSTFLNAALEEQYYRNLIKALQRFAQVAGLLRLNTPRDALMTTLSKAAVPPHVLNAVTSEGAKSPSTESPRVFSNPKGLLSVDSFASQASSISADRDRRSSIEHVRSTLSARNLLCLRALLNLAIALGPTLGGAFNVVVDALKQADIILSTGLPQQAIRQANFGSQKATDSAAAVQAFSAEVAAVEAAASRLLESTAEYPNDAFSAVLRAFLRLLSGRSLDASSTPRLASPPGTPMLKERTFSGLPGISTFAEMRARDYQFVIPKLGDLARLNINRFISTDPTESGWTSLIDELTRISVESDKPRDARRASTDVLCRVAAEMITEVAVEYEQSCAAIQQRALVVLMRIVNGIYSEDGELTSIDLEIQTHILEALKAILERSGDTVISGWHETVAILSTAFERTETPSRTLQQDADFDMDWEHIGSELVSIPVGRAAFTAAQLVCADFLASLPVDVMPSLIELLHRFITQTEDLNIALTAVTMAWNVADYLFGAVRPDEIEALAASMKEADDVREEAQRAASSERAAQLLFVMFRLREAINGTNKEVRNATFQTMCSIFKDHGNQLAPASWELMLRNVLIRVATDDAMAHLAEAEREQTPDIRKRDVDASRIIVEGVAEAVAQHLRTIEQIKKLPSLWEVMLSTLEAYIDCENHILNAAVFGALAKILSQGETGNTIWTTPAYRTVALWLKRLPEQAEGTSTKDGNQSAYIAYVETASQLYRLTMESMSSPQTRKFIDNLIACVEQSDGPRYNADVGNLSPLQSKTLEILKSIRTDQPNMPSRLIGAGAQLAKLHHVRGGNTSNGPTFVAVASEAIDWLSAMILSHVQNPEVLETGAVLSGMQSLRLLMADKYGHQTEHKASTLWRRATAAAQKLAGPILKLTDDTKLDQSVKTSLWAEFVVIATSIAKANALESVTDEKKIYDDEQADIESFKDLEDVLIPRLGYPGLPDELRSSYCRSLFEASIVHQTEHGEIPKPQTSPLTDLQNIRRGRVKPIPYSRREDMCYVCFASLIALASANDTTSEFERLAQAAAPLLILRLAIPIRAYIADQPLRGRKPQPLSELEELLYAFEQIGKLRLHPHALAADLVAGGRTGEQAHLHFLYPLLAKAVATAGDRWSGAAEVLDPLQKLLESISHFRSLDG